MVCHYTGREPSPKGFGLCAHEMTEGTRSKGTDGNLWKVVADKNGRLSWKRDTRRVVLSRRKREEVTTTVKKLHRARDTLALKRSGFKEHMRKSMRAYRAKDMDGALANLKFLETIDYEAYEYEPDADKPWKVKDLPTVLFVPQKGYKVRYAKKGAKGKKGWLIGQFGISNLLGIIWENEESTGPIERHASNSDFAQWIYEYRGYLVTGTGADPVFEIL